MKATVRDKLAEQYLSMLKPTVNIDMHMLDVRNVEKMELRTYYRKLLRLEARNLIHSNMGYIVLLEEYLSRLSSTIDYDHQNPRAM